MNPLRDTSDDRHFIRALLALLALLPVALLGAQVNPEDAFGVSWVTFADQNSAYLAAVVRSDRGELTVLDYEIEVLSTDAASNQRVVRQSGQASVPAGATDTTGTVTLGISPGTTLAANVRFTNAQEGWSITDTIERTVGAPVAQQQAIAIDPDFLEVDGLVSDRTLTKAGQDFFQLFYQAWQPPLGAASYAILVEEVPFRGRQTVIQISINDEEPVYQQIVQQRYDVIEEMVEQAVQYVAYHLELAMQAGQSRDGEIGEAIETY